MKEQSPRDLHPRDGDRRGFSRARSAGRGNQTSRVRNLCGTRRRTRPVSWTIGFTANANSKAGCFRTRGRARKRIRASVDKACNRFARNCRVGREHISKASIHQPGQQPHLLICQIHFCKMVVNDPDAGYDFLDADIYINRTSVLRQRNKFCNREPSRPWGSENRDCSKEMQSTSSLVLRLKEYTPSQSPPLRTLSDLKELNTTSGYFSHVTGDS
jgi:hypothetical protein